MNDTILNSILEELQTIRTLLELPSDVKKSYDDQLNKLDEKISTTVVAIDVTPMDEDRKTACNAELSDLVKEYRDILKYRREHLDGWNKYQQ